MAVSKSQTPSASPCERNPVLVTAWIIFCSLCSCEGWLLSALHQLNAAGYAVTFLLSLGVIWLLRNKLFPGGWPGWDFRKARRRFRQALPLAFLILAALAFLGGAIHPPSNYDALAYRVPRVLHWLADGQWHWIHTDFQRVNTRACGIEWLSGPLIAFTRSDRPLFLINAFSYLLLPGLVFSLFRRVGVRPRVAWHWMWLLPTGYCYLLQAGSISNDMFSTVYTLAAVDFALRARKSGRLSQVVLSLLSVALMTGAKTSNRPLLLPWVVAFAPTWRIWLARPVAVGGAAVLAGAVSFLPMAALNTVYGGDWSGASIEHVPVGAAPVWLHLVANGGAWPLDNLAPPVFPFASVWNRAADALRPESLAALFRKYPFEPGAVDWHLGEIQVEEEAGLGFGITSLLLLSLLAGFLGRRRGETASRKGNDLFLRVLCLAPWVSLLFLMTQLNANGSVRYLASYCPLVIMGLLRGSAQSAVVRRKWWRAWAFLAFALALLLLILSPARPLWPAQWFIDHYGPRLKNNRLAKRALDAYATKGQRSEVFAPLLALLPKNVKRVGYVADDCPETSLWKPFGSRRIIHVRLTDSGEEMRRRGITYVLLMSTRIKEPWSEWLRERNARELQAVALKMYGSLPPFLWHVVVLDPIGPDSGQPAPEPKPADSP